MGIGTETRRIFYENGKVQSELSYKDDKLDGLCRTYYESGSLLSEASFKDDMMHGVRREYYKNGQLKREDIWSYSKPLSSVRYDEHGTCILVKKY
jgi:antitoxin component YwqK of YwqJK toxin-antitoxin module